MASCPAKRSWSPTTSGRNTTSTASRRLGSLSATAGYEACVWQTLRTQRQRSCAVHRRTLRLSRASPRPYKTRFRGCPCQPRPCGRVARVGVQTGEGPAVAGGHRALERSGRGGRRARWAWGLSGRCWSVSAAPRPLSGRNVGYCGRCPCRNRESSPVRRRRYFPAECPAPSDVDAWAPPP
jgi:hypothetical protein